MDKLQEMKWFPWSHEYSDCIHSLMLAHDQLQEQNVSANIETSYDRILLQGRCQEIQIGFSL